MVRPGGAARLDKLSAQALSWSGCRLRPARFPEPVSAEDSDIFSKIIRLGTGVPRFKINLIKCLALGLVLMSLAAWQRPAEAASKRKPPPEPVRIGIFLPMTGLDALDGQNAYKGLMLAHKHRPLVLTDRPVELLLSDTTSKPAKTAKLVEDLRNDDHVHALIGGLDVETLSQAKPALGGAAPPLLTPTSLDPALYPAETGMFSTAFPLEAAGDFAARFALTGLKAQDVAVVCQANEALSRARAGRFEAAFKAQGGRRVFKHLASTGRDMSWADGLAGQTPDAVFICGGLEFTARAAKALALAGFSRPLIGVPEAARQELATLGGPAVEKMYLIAQFDPAGVRTPLGRRFVRACRTEHPILKPSRQAALAYLAYNLILDAMERTNGTDGQALIAALASSGHQGLLGPLTLTGGRTVKPAVVKMVKDGKLYWLTTLEP